MAEQIHQQLDTKHKLFCNCSTEMKEKNPLMLIERKQHPVQSELGEVDVAAQYEYLRDRTFCYQVFKNEDCLIECDEEPIKPVNQEALEIALQIALLLNCRVPDEIHVMRKTVIDGSNTSAFQRTMIIGLNGFLEYKGKKIEIRQVSLEEDAAAIIEEKNGRVTYRLNRLGIPLVEISTGLLIGYSPREVQEIAKLIGLICRSVKKVKRGIGTIRQDINVSIKRGARTEIKGVQELSLLSKVIELEVKRQLDLIKNKKKVKEETRVALPDGRTKFIRPLPGAARLYPETDIPPVLIKKEFLERIKENLPEALTKKLERLKKNFKLSEELADQMIVSEYLELFEKIIKKFKVTPSVVAHTFVSALKDLKRREGIEVEKLREKDFEELFSLLEKGKLMKESIPEILKYRVKHPDVPMLEGIKKLGLEAISKEDLLKIVREIIEKNKGKPEGKIIGLVMSRVRGRVKSEDVVKIVKRELNNYSLSNEYEI